MWTHTSFLLLITLWALMHDGLGLSVMNELKEEGGSSIPTQRIRTKRCACNNFLDSECHYFCHLDIIWINTPSKTTLYGLGSILSRRRRSTGRCTCAKPDDRSCTSFCHHSSDIKSQEKHQPNIQSILRVLAKGPHRKKNF
ncbi:endothelin-2 [Echeneis naucrates]|uniref:endothelin-2 n=1 Tax=Echeneis naucrates TaxID=173247 RepID=UPI0011143269|nr:endothelin-2-like [Echeneis naucrates]